MGFKVRTVQYRKTNGLTVCVRKLHTNRFRTIKCLNNYRNYQKVHHLVNMLWEVHCHRICCGFWSNACEYSASYGTLQENILWVTVNRKQIFCELQYTASKYFASYGTPLANILQVTVHHLQIFCELRYTTCKYSASYGTPLANILRPTGHR